MERPEFLHEYDLDSLVLIQPRARGFSMYVTPRYRQHYEQLPFEPFSADLICKQLSRVRLFVDVGAHYGFYTLLAAKRDTNLEVLACEPTPETFRVLEQNVALNGLQNVTLHQVAISDRNGTVPFNISLASDSCGFHANPEAMPLRQIEVAANTLDQLLAEHEPCPTLIKIDTEGHELAVLRGLTSTLQRFHDLHLLMEFNPAMLRAAGGHQQALLSCLDQIGYRALFIEEDSRQMTQVKCQEQLSDLVKARGYANLYCVRQKPAKVGSKARALVKCSIELPRSWKLRRRPLTIQGWCLGEGEIVIHAITARRGKHVWNARCGLPRDDVAQAFPSDPMAPASGFDLDVSIPIWPERLTIEAEDQYGRRYGLLSRWVSRWRRLLKGRAQPPPGPSKQKTTAQVLNEISGCLRFKSCVLAVSHSDYRIAIGGTQKLLQQEEQLLAARGVSYLELHPALEPKVVNNGHGPFRMGFYVDAQFLGEFTLAQLRQILTVLQVRRGIRIQAVHLHHLMGYDLHLIEQLLQDTPGRKTVFIHDFYTVCKQWNLLKNDREFCDAPRLESDRCQDCAYGKERPAHFNAYRAFFEKWKPDFVVPSAVARDIWVKSFPMFAGKVRVIPHLVSHQITSAAKLWAPGTKIRIGYVGYQHINKGWEQWKQLVAALGVGAYEFVVLGTCSELLSAVRCVPVSFIDQGPDAMIRALQKENIDLAFLWSLVPETYSFTVFEAMAAGCFVLTNPHSGNIAAQVRQSGRGWIANDIDDLINWLQDTERLKSLLNQFHRHNAPFELFPNPALADELAAGQPNVTSPGHLQSSPLSFGNTEKTREFVFFTSITSSYLPKAAVLAQTLRRHRPGAAFYVVLCDTAPAGLEKFAQQFDHIFLLNELCLPTPNLEQWIFKHSVVELCTAVKGPFLRRVLEELKPHKVVYFDPDVVVLDDLKELESLLEAHSIILTPHLVDPESSLSGIIDNEVCSLKHGVFNLGFVAVRNSVEGRRFAAWWSDRLMEFCYDDIANGLFTDQRWMDLAPAFFPDLYILHDKTYNVATWNLSQRRVQKRSDGRLCIDGRPIKFFHFSGFDSGAQLAMLQRYGQHSPALFELRDWYLEELKIAGHQQFGSKPWGYSRFSNGKPILPAQRRLYRTRPDLMEAFPRPATVENGDRSFYRWCAEQGDQAGPVQQGPPLSTSRQRSLLPPVKLLQHA